jgi:tripartite-type tricarboxylate transporter receptor subunit TctC
MNREERDMKGWKIVWLMSGIIFFMFYGSCLAQQKYPSRPIEMVVPFAPGGSADVAARAYTDDLSKALKVSILIVNRAGGTGIQGVTYVVKGKKDGYTLLGTTGTPLIIMPNISREVTYDPLKDLIPIGRLGSAPSVFAVRSDSPFKTLKELIEYARQNPGKLKNGAGGVGTESNFNLAILCSKEKINITSIPFQSGGEAVPALLGGHVDMSSNTLASLGPQVKAGKLRGLAIGSKMRHPDFPDVPTVAEVGHPEANFAVWFAMYAPTGAPQQVVDVLVPAVQKVFESPEVIQRCAKLGIEHDYMGPADTRKLIEMQLRTVERVAKEAGMQKK